MTTASATVTSRGQVTLPRVVREAIGDSKAIEFQVNGNIITVQPIPDMAGGWRSTPKISRICRGPRYAIRSGQRLPMTKHPDSLIDANAVLIYVLGNRPDVAEAVKSVFDGLRSGEKAALLLESVLVECVYVLQKRYEVPKAEIVKHLDGILRYPGVVNQDKADLREALKLYGENSLDIVDCVLVAKSRIGGLEIVSFDGSLKKLKKKVR
ncbi:type II toxin-antitoxin system VapC family toxin [Geobacter sp. FeAm09]|uniref:PIN domain-containing protein n=1 Tax=Geobacter sp. FeAm09 TaxID=2597769 RepID=UPI0011EBBA93|nr:PIN domain-containing protein [Geobacter sp. FeAm09]QEM69497.1 type II toxin-antitoxin system VapC family toxin [Geobacter sp. FeAm09]